MSSKPFPVKILPLSQQQSLSFYGSHFATEFIYLDTTPPLPPTPPHFLNWNHISEAHDGSAGFDYSGFPPFTK